MRGHENHHDHRPEQRHNVSQTHAHRPRHVLILAVVTGLAATSYHPEPVDGAIDVEAHREFDPNPAWPLCGRIAAAPPAGWSAATHGCPVVRWGNPDHADYPIHSGYGPRILVTEKRYDFHPGIDIPTPLGTPVFAIAGGVVKKVTGSGEVRIEIQHYRTGAWGGDCEPDGCYHSVNQHLQSAVVVEEQRVKKGQLIGYSGASSSGFAHLHFEIRNAPVHDGTSSWMHNTIQPLRVLPYHPSPGGTQIAITNVDTSDPMNPRVTVQTVQAADPDPALDQRKYDINQIEVQIYDKSTWTVVRQPGMVTDDDGYHVNPSVLDIEVRNHVFTHKDGGAQPWESFDTCPYSYLHGDSYTPFVHTCQNHPNDAYTGSFNGIDISPEAYHISADYRLTVTFKELLGVIDVADLCVMATVKNVRGVPGGQPASWNCDS